MQRLYTAWKWNIMRAEQQRCIRVVSPRSPVCWWVMLALRGGRGSGLVDLGVEPIQLLGGGLRQVGRRCWRGRRGRAADEGLGRGRLAEVADAGVVWVAVVVFDVRDGGWVGGDEAGVDVCVSQVTAGQPGRKQVRVSSVEIQIIKILSV